MKVQRLLWVYSKPGPEFMFVIKVPGVDGKNDHGDNEDDDIAERSPLSPPQTGPSRRPSRPPIRPPAPHRDGGGGGPATMDTATVTDSSRERRHDRLYGAGRRAREVLRRLRRMFP